MSYPYNLGISFYSVAAEQGGRTALRYPSGEKIDYRGLNERSNRMGRYLLSKGFVKGDVIALFNEKSEIAYSLMLGCLKTGVIYTNLDVSSPSQRLIKILGNCQPKAIFFDKQDEVLWGTCREALPDSVLIDLHDEGLRADAASLEGGDLEESLQVNGGDAAYIMFTSGSTGFPKGAVMSHNNLLNFIQWGRTTFAVTPEDVFTNANPIYFDNSVFDFYTSLFNGATLVPLSHDLVKNAQKVVQAINDSGCTIWFSVPSLLVYLLTTKSLTAADFKTIRRISFGGEGFPKNKLKQLYDLFGERITLFNVYGPTECTCICSSYIISAEDFDNMNELAPLGHMAPNFGYTILPFDESNPDFGELALMGPCVGLGYYNDPARTGQSFVQNPQSRFQQLMYKTGDVVQRATNGYLHFRGRVDNQIKHMGYRIELEEVEAAFASLHYINEVGVVYEKINAELGQIKAFVSVASGDVRKEGISADLKAILPPYMLPRVITILEILPKNANGKIDRKALSTL